MKNRAFLDKIKHISLFYVALICHFCSCLDITQIQYKTELKIVDNIENVLSLRILFN